MSGSYACSKVSSWRGKTESCPEFKGCRNNQEQEKQTCLFKYSEKMILQLHCEACGLLLCISVRDPYHTHSLCLLVFLGCGAMPGCLVPGRPVLAVLLFWECTKIFIGLGKSVGSLPGRSVLCPRDTVSGNPC